MQTPPDSDSFSITTASDPWWDTDEATSTELEDSHDNSSSPAHVLSPTSTSPPPLSNNKTKLLVRRKKACSSAPYDVCRHVPTVVSRPPSSAATRLKAEFIAMTHKTARTGSWFRLIPVRIGHSDSVDYASKALVKASQYLDSNSSAAITEESCLSSYTRAIVSAQHDMEKAPLSDLLLITVGLLVNFERTFAWSSVPLHSHMQGITALWLSQTKSSTPPSDVVRAMQYGFVPMLFLGPCAMSEPSPFEIPRWLEADPVLFAEDLTAPVETVARLKKLSYQLFIRLPRLVMLVKGVQANPEPGKVDAAVELARELLEYEDIDAESDLLHYVQIQRVGEPSETAQYRMNFHSMPEYESAVQYWCTRIMLARLCFRLLGLFPNKAQVLMPKAELQTSVSRMSSNILMSASWSLESGGVGENVFAFCLVAVWGALTDYDVFAGRGMTPTRVRLLLKQYAQGIMRLPTLDEVAKRLDAAADLFSGGSPSSGMAMKFKQPTQNR